MFKDFSFCIKFMEINCEKECLSSVVCFTLIDFKVEM